MKSYAVQVLAACGGPEAQGLLREAARDADPAGWMQVIEHVAPHEDGCLLLHEALADEEATVRSLAALASHLRR